MAIVYPVKDAVVNFSTGARKVAPDQPWHDQAPEVKERPELFASEPGRVYGQPMEVEQATRAPGEKRSTKRSKDTDDGNAAG